MEAAPALAPFLVIALGAAGGWIGYRMRLADTRDPPDQPARILRGRWIFGGILCAVLLGLLWLLSRVATCGTARAGAEAAQLDLEACPAGVAAWYAVLTEWQTGIGGGLALIGLIWAAYFERKSKG